VATEEVAMEEVAPEDSLKMQNRDLLQMKIKKKSNSFK
jgi:hypothetical protein